MTVEVFDPENGPFALGLLYALGQRCSKLSGAEDSPLVPAIVPQTKHERMTAMLGAAAGLCDLRSAPASSAGKKAPAKRAAGAGDGGGFRPESVCMRFAHLARDPSRVAQVFAVLKDGSGMGDPLRLLDGIFEVARRPKGRSGPIGGADAPLQVSWQALARHYYHLVGRPSEEQVRTVMHGLMRMRMLDAPGVSPPQPHKGGDGSGSGSGSGSGAGSGSSAAGGSRRRSSSLDNHFLDAPEELDAFGLGLLWALGSSLGGAGAELEPSPGTGSPLAPGSPAHCDGAAGKEGPGFVGNRDRTNSSLSFSTVGANSNEEDEAFPGGQLLFDPTLGLIYNRLKSSALAPAAAQAPLDPAQPAPEQDVSGLQLAFLYAKQFYSARREHDVFEFLRGKSGLSDPRHLFRCIVRVAAAQGGRAAVPFVKVASLYMLTEQPSDSQVAAVREGVARLRGHKYGLHPEQTLDQPESLPANMCEALGHGAVETPPAALSVRVPKRPLSLSRDAEQLLLEVAGGASADLLPRVSALGSSTTSPRLKKPKSVTFADAATPKDGPTSEADAAGSALADHAAADPIAALLGMATTPIHPPE
jgi:hypothetical protein